MTAIVDFITARLDEDEQIARAAIGARGRAAGDTVQHWKWERTDDDVSVGDGTGPIDQQFLYPRDQVPEGVIADRVALRTIERYPTSTGGDLSDFVLPDVEEPTAGAAQHIARHDPARTLQQAEAMRRVVEAEIRNLISFDGELCTCEPDEVRAGECDRWTPERSELLRALASAWSDHPDYQGAWRL